MPDPHLGAIRKVNPSAQGCRTVCEAAVSGCTYASASRVATSIKHLFETVEIKGFGPAEAPESSDR
jgi:hypothetical protein